MNVDVSDLTFSVDVAGPDEGRPVLLLHGFPQSARCWSRVTPPLNEAGLRTVAPDQRGYSPAARPAEDSAYAMPELVGDVIGMLDTFGLSTVDIVGHDWGAVVGWQVAGRHPERVRSLVAVSVPHPIAFGQAMAADPDQRERSAYMTLSREKGKAEQVLLDGDARRLRAMFAGSGLSDDEVDAYVRPLQTPGALTGALAWYRAMSRWEGLGPVTAPTTFVWSDQDIAVGRVAAQACERYVAGPYRFVELAGISHWIPDQAPEAVVAAVLERTVTA